MSTLKRALERSKAAWEAVGKPERARAVLRYDGVTVFYREAGANAVVRLADEHLHRWRAIVPKAKYEPVGTVPVVGDVVVCPLNLDARWREPMTVESIDTNFAWVSKEVYHPLWRFKKSGNGISRVLKRKVPKKAEVWPRYYVGASGETALVLRSATLGDGTYYNKAETEAPIAAWWEPGDLQKNNFKPVTAHQFAEWLYDKGFTEAAWKIEPMWEPKCIAYAGDWMMRDGVPARMAGAAPGLRTSGILRRSRARRAAIAEIEARLKALGDVK